MSSQGRKKSIQTTFDVLKSKLEAKVADGVEERLEDIAYYAVSISPVSTGAYVNSFSIGAAGFGGGRSSSSDNKPKGQNPQAMQNKAFSQLMYDIQNIDFEDALKSGNTRFTLRNRSPHAQDVEDGLDWEHTDGYHVFGKIKRNFS